MLFQKEYITGSLMPRIQELWQSAECTFPPFLTEINAGEKGTNEKWITESTERIRLHLKAFPSRSAFTFPNKKGSERITPRQQIWLKETESLFHSLLLTEPVLGIRNALSPQTLDAFQDKIKQFLRKVRSFAPDMELEDMGQAIRNYMVYAIFREQNGLPQKCSSSIFGYSMLYPFTDNFLDDPSHTEEEKIHYNKLIHHRISGLPVTPLSLHEEKTAMLLDAIAADYPGPEADEAYGAEAAADIRQGLLLMLEAQEISQKQTDASLSLTEKNILDISIYKGGLSVLIDRYFINCKMTEQDALFYFGFGFLLQICDDLQDIAQDRESGSRTLLSRCQTPEEREDVVNRLFHYTDRLFHFSPPSSAAFRNFLLQNCFQLILSSAAGSGDFFSSSYLEGLERAFPVSFSYLKQTKEKMPAAFSAGKPADQNRMMDMLDAVLSESPS
ncbi:hypothetical protein BLA28_05790 [Eisenbergiella tayi]|uniref:Uncharacterized protein n=1 Tax=Eisenbergiella tayi TaxID=1432052 RepID=A0A1E3AZL9_9FIRM|nr:hypothetical protein [Eisenbergiella tayi]ODM13961.1 hypothetical protein BEH84_01682 [Eisenbergiella tayi]OIZ66447.1 hypothetical protein BLA28_05790 [Eisenbergiella tayi]